MGNIFDSCNLANGAGTDSSELGSCVAMPSSNSHMQHTCGQYGYCQLAATHPVCCPPPMQIRR